MKKVLITLKYINNINNNNFRIALLGELSLGKVQNEDFDKFKLLVNILLNLMLLLKKNITKQLTIIN